MTDAPSKQSEDGVRYGDMSDSLGFLLRLGQLTAFRDFYRDIGDLGVRPGEMTVLMLLDENPGIRQGVLARHLMIKRAHMTKMMRAMEADGLVRRTVPEDDKRSVELWLTDTGADRVQSNKAPFETHESRVLGRLSKREATQLKRLLRVYLNIPDKVTEPSEESGS